MVTIVAKHIILEDKVESFKALAQELIKETRKEKGCIKYCLYEDVDHKNILTFIEDWESRESINMHLASTHFTRIMPQLKLMLLSNAEVDFYEILGY